MTTTFKHFSFAHLPTHLQSISIPMAELAQKMESDLPEGPEKEANMIKEYRDIIFGARDAFDRDGITVQHIREAILDVHTKLTVQVEMLKTFEGRQWEAGLHKSLLNDITNFAFYLKESKYPDVAAMVANF